MCLLTKQKEPLIAEEDIIVYKVFHSDNRSLCIGFDYSPYINKKFDDSELECIVENYDYIFIYDGFIHSYTGISFALFYTYLLNKREKEDAKYVVRECKIPKGSKYYKSDTDSEMASKSIIIGDIIYG